MPEWIFRPVMAPEIMEGIRDRMPPNRMMEIPFPIPNSVTCSPIHMTKEEPATKDTMMTKAAQMLVSVRMLLFFISI